MESESWSPSVRKKRINFFVQTFYLTPWLQAAQKLCKRLCAILTQFPKFLRKLEKDRNYLIKLKFFYLRRTI